ncbi:metallophosphoesterase domain-containing protein 1 [Cylindrobasidium torrendii FP15055 ss-10]|uniref:Metallophosphoesterase domain-containing protein 1 n=1 Tax=Cylindrobasidium torrendii FP15055 ss-10 TaxID=1314674 RepID=A0A0D7B8S1_9AGAR|nr:metallophosphoesterase domain-containing protein 1 [Cylindrobasidium torrendii FP15055 ss-10]
MSLEALFDRKPPTLWQQFTDSSLLFVAERAHKFYSTNFSKLEYASGRIRVVCISDTHNAHESLPTLPAGDILIHAGDLTNSGTACELESVLGNHDTALATPANRDAILSCYPSLTYLEDSSITLNVRERRIIVYGSPRTPRHGSGVFQYPRHEANWSHIPLLTDILVTHGPPAHHLDSRGAGCMSLLQALWRVRPRLHIFGHIHVGHGVECLGWSNAQMAYECLLAGKRRWRDTLCIALATLQAFFRGRPGFNGREGTILVNAASVGGLKDEKRRKAIVIELI